MERMKRKHKDSIDQCAPHTTLFGRRSLNEVINGFYVGKITATRDKADT
jgi:hypothetical protein